MRKLAIRLLRELDRWLYSRFIPIDRFGVEEIPTGYVDYFGCAQHRIITHWPNQERERFYQHNRNLESLCIRLRRAALRLERGA